MFWAIVVMIALLWTARRLKRAGQERQIAMNQPADWHTLGPNVSVARNMPMIRVKWKGQVDTSAYSTQGDAWQAAAAINWLLSLKAAEQEAMDRIIGTKWRGN